MKVLNPNTISIEQQYLIKQSVRERHYRTGETHQAIYHKFYSHFKIPKYQDLSASNFNEAIKFLSDIALNDNVNFISVNRTNLICLVRNMIWLTNFFREKRLYDIFKALNSDFGVKMNDHFIDGACVASAFKHQLQQEQSLQLTD